MKTYKGTFIATPAIVMEKAPKDNLLGLAYVVRADQFGYDYQIVESISGDVTHLEDRKNCWIYPKSYGITLGSTLKDYLKLLDEYEDKKVQLEAPVPNDWVMLNDGSFLKKDYGKYRTNLLIINDVPELNFIETSSKEFNLDLIPDLTFVKGDYFVTKKGADAFRIKPDGKHLLLCDNWGGAFNSYRGGNSPDADECLYQRRASSNGGGSGNTFSIVEEGFKRSISIDDL